MEISTLTKAKHNWSFGARTFVHTDQSPPHIAISHQQYGLPRVLCYDNIVVIYTANADIVIIYTASNHHQTREEEIVINLE